MTRPLKFVDQNIDDYAMKVTYDPVKGTGKLVYNISLVKNEDFDTLSRFSRTPARPGFPSAASSNSALRERTLPGTWCLKDARPSARSAASPSTAC